MMSVNIFLCQKKYPEKAVYTEISQIWSQNLYKNAAIL